MNDLYNLILDRHSCRAYKPQPVEQHKLEQIVNAGICAPTGMNRQETHFLVVTQERLTKLIDAVVAAIMTGELPFPKAVDASFRPHYDAPCLILVSAPTTSSLGCQDCSCALENIFLAATSLNLGSCWINILAHASKVESVRKLLLEFGMPSEHTVYGSASIGYPATPPRIVEHIAETRISWC